MEVTQPSLRFSCLCCSRQKNLTVTHKNCSCKRLDAIVQHWSGESWRADQYRTLLTTIAALIKLCLRAGWYDDCEGCKIDDPSQLHHDCLTMGDEYKDRLIRKLCYKLDPYKIMVALEAVYGLKEIFVPTECFKMIVNVLKYIKRVQSPSENVKSMYEAGDEDTRFIMKQHLRKKNYRRYFKIKYLCRSLKPMNMTFINA